MQKEELINHLNEYLKVSEYQDSSKNGLQVDNTKDRIKKVGYSVDLTSYIIDKAIEEDVDMILSHHGIYWGFEQTATGVAFQRLKKLIDNNICTYACHLPLDANGKLGNNIGIIKELIKHLELENYNIEDFGEYEGFTIGYGVRFDKSIEIDDVKNILINKLGLRDGLYNFGNKKLINSIGAVSGGAARISQQAKNNNYDLFITGEGVHYEITGAKEIEQSIFLGGHRETEIFGPRLVAQHLEEKHDIEIVFLDENY